ncbi:phage protease [uncultured Akkermansia sp.]|uniref:phage protease n=1 Tax=uncultured Akkermansia sp. TaxID=512294 RepID=UPI00262B3C70|nr:phage protease [uncultured Akkermansia sp.]
MSNQAAASVPRPVVCQDDGMILYAKHAFYTTLAGTGDIQWMPPGKHTIHPSNDKGEVVERTVLVDEAAAEAVEELRRKLQEGAADGLMDEPYIDYDHQDHDAAGWVKRIYWGGDDPKTGGIRAEIEWTPEGKAKVEGKSYRRFSPVFKASEPDEDGVCRIIGSGINMGGLVNRAAFQTIAPLLGKDGNPAVPVNQTQTAKTTMNEEEIKALQAQLEALKTENEELKKSLADMKARAADASVEKACEEGRITPDLKASWKEMILADPKAEILLAKLPVNPVFAQQYKTGDNKDGGGPKLTGEKLLAKHASITDPAERLAFFRAHEKELIAARG